MNTYQRAPSVPPEHQEIVERVTMEGRLAAAERAISDARADAAKEVATIREAMAKQSAFQRWVIVLLIGIGSSISGVAYSAHSQMGDRMIDLTRLTEQQLGRLEERIAAIQQYGLTGQCRRSE